MLSVNNYPQEYIDACRARIDAQVATYRALTATVPRKHAATVDAFAPRFFDNLVIVLDALFMHRSRTIEGKDGNPMNEVRVLCGSMLQNDGLIAKDKSIKLDPARSVLGKQVGDPIELTEAEFVRLAEAFFAAVEHTFG